MLLRIAAVAGLAFAGFKFYEKRRADEGVRPASQRDTWDMVDEESDQSFPASDPPGNY